MQLNVLVQYKKGSIIILSCTCFTWVV